MTLYYIHVYNYVYVLNLAVVADVRLLILYVFRVSTCFNVFTAKITSVIMTWLAQHSVK